MSAYLKRKEYIMRSYICVSFYAFSHQIEFPFVACLFFTSSFHHLGILEAEEDTRVITQSNLMANDKHEHNLFHLIWFALCDFYDMFWTDWNANLFSGNIQKEELPVKDWSIHKRKFNRFREKHEKKYNDWIFSKFRPHAPTHTHDRFKANQLFVLVDRREIKQKLLIIPLIWIVSEKKGQTNKSIGFNCQLSANIRWLICSHGRILSTKLRHNDYFNARNMKYIAISDERKIINGEKQKVRKKKGNKATDESGNIELGF